MYPGKVPIRGENLPERLGRWVSVTRTPLKKKRHMATPHGCADVLTAWQYWKLCQVSQLKWCSPFLSVAHTSKLITLPSFICACGRRNMPRLLFREKLAIFFPSTQANKTCQGESWLVWMDAFMKPKIGSPAWTIEEITRPWLAVRNNWEFRRLELEFYYASNANWPSVVFKQACPSLSVECVMGVVSKYDDHQLGCIEKCPQPCS